MRMARNLSWVLFLLLGTADTCRPQGEVPPELLMSVRDSVYTEFGLVAGTPSGLNLLLGQWFDRWGLRASGMIYGANMRGIQLYAGFEFWRHRNHRYCIGLVGGTWHDTHNNWRFVGPAYDLYIGDFFVEFGVSWGKGSYMANQVIWQVGYSHSLF